MDTDILIVGGGLAGLHLATQLQQTGREYQLVEARDRFGGRIKSIAVDGASFDLGPAWFWPGQPRIAALIKALDLESFEQYSDGFLVIEDDAGHIQRSQGYGAMPRSLRLVGGLQSLTDRLAARIPASRRHLAMPIIHLNRTPSAVVAQSADGHRIRANRVVLAAPPRVIAQTIEISPPLGQSAATAVRNIPTWMAGQAKALAVYDRPFWREAGLSGTAMSRRGPMVELHDASPKAGGPYAVFGFIGVPPAARTDRAALEQACLSQLTRLFGPPAETPLLMVIQDWAQHAATATPLDFQPVYAHPSYNHPGVLQDLWDNALILTGTELAPESGGYMEGALVAGDAARIKLEEWTNTR